MDLLIEFVGLPGAGKTATCLEVYRDLAKRGVPVKHARGISSRRLPAMTISGQISIMETIKARRQMAHSNLEGEDVTGASMFWSDRQRISYYVALTIGRNMRLRQRAGLAVVDQGLLQAVWSYYMRCSDTAELSILGNTQRAAIPDLAIELRVDSTLARTRLTERKKLPRSLQKGESSEQLPSSAFARMETVRAFAECNGVDWRALVVANNQNKQLENVIAEVVLEKLQ